MDTDCFALLRKALESSVFIRGHPWTSVFIIFRPCGVGKWPRSLGLALAAL